MTVRQHFRVALILLGLFTLCFGLIYPGISTLSLNLLFPDLAQGSLLQDQVGHLQGSELIGQNFSDPKYFWGRLSATAVYPYNASASNGSNLGPRNPALVDNVKNRVQALRAADPKNNQTIPIDLVTASGSGLDPQISIAAATYQISRVARVNHLPENVVQRLVMQNTLDRQWGVLGEPRVNVLQLNLALVKQTSAMVETHG